MTAPVQTDALHNVRLVCTLHLRSARLLTNNLRIDNLRITKSASCVHGRSRVSVNPCDSVSPRLEAHCRSREVAQVDILVVMVGISGTPQTLNCEVQVLVVEPNRRLRKVDERLASTARHPSLVGIGILSRNEAFVSSFLLRYLHSFQHETFKGAQDCIIAVTEL